MIEKINKTYARYDSFIAAAFDLRSNPDVLAAASINLSEEVGVSPS
jgi:hypothetical protein